MTVKIAVKTGPFSLDKKKEIPHHEGITVTNALMEANMEEALKETITDGNGRRLGKDYLVPDNTTIVIDYQKNQLP